MAILTPHQMIPVEDEAAVRRANLGPTEPDTMVKVGRVTMFRSSTPAGMLRRRADELLRGAEEREVQAKRADDDAIRYRKAAEEIREAAEIYSKAADLVEGAQ